MNLIPVIVITTTLACPSSGDMHVLAQELASGQQITSPVMIDGVCITINAGTPAGYEPKFYSLKRNFVGIHLPGPAEADVWYVPSSALKPIPAK